MPLEWSQESGYAKLMRHWNTPKRDGGQNANGFEEYPKAMYRARRPESGGPIQCIDPYNDAFSRGNYREVGGKEAEEKALRDGWRLSPKEAIDHAEALEKAVSDAAAEAAFKVKRMGEKAREEFALVDGSTSEHVPEITPELVAQAKDAKRGPGRPRKDAAGA